MSTVKFKLYNLINMVSCFYYLVDFFCLGFSFGMLLKIRKIGYPKSVSVKYIENSYFSAILLPGHARDLRST